MIGLDTNVALRWLAADALPVEDAAQVAAVADLLSRDEGEPVYLSDVVLAEVVWTLASRMKVPRPEIGAVLTALLEEPRVRLASPAAVAEARDAYILGGPGFADHLIGVLGRLAGCRATITFDKAAGRLKDFGALTV